MSVSLEVPAATLPAMPAMTVGRPAPGMILTCTQTHVQGARNDEDLQGQSFELVSLIGAGSFAEVWKCRSRTSEGERAVKILRDGDIDKAREECIKAMCAIKAALSDDTVNLHGMAEANLFDEEGNLLRSLTMICMQYIDGTSLANIVPYMRGNEDSIKRMMYDVGQAVWVLHCNGIIHLDIKPANVLLDMNGKFFLTDFGVSIFLCEYRKAKRMPTVGTPLYMAPEIFKPPCCYDLKVDIWSMGTMAYECFVGRPPLMEEDETTAPNPDWIFAILTILPYIDMTPVKEAGGTDGIRMFLGQTMCINPERRVDIRGLLRHPFLILGDGLAAREEIAQFVREYRAATEP